MEQIAKVEFNPTEMDKLIIFKWLRKQIGLSPLEAKEKIESNIFNFNGEFEEAIKFYNYLNVYSQCGARLIIDVNYGVGRLMGSFGVTLPSEKEIKEDKKYKKEFE